MPDNRALRRWRQRDRFSAEHLNEAVDMLHPLRNLYGSGLVDVYRTMGGTAFHGREPDVHHQEIILAKLTVRDTIDDRKYAWEEAVATPTGYRLAGSEVHGTVTDDFALDVTDPDIRVDITNAFVPLGRGYCDGPDGIVPCLYVLGFRLPFGEHQWMSMTKVTSNQWGAEMDRIHGLVPNPS